METGEGADNMLTREPSIREGQRWNVGETTDDVAEIQSVGHTHVLVHFLVDDVKIPYRKEDVEEAIKNNNWL